MAPGASTRGFADVSIPPDGQITESCPAPLRKIFRFSFDPNHFTESHRPVPQRGVRTSRTRDGMWWTRQRGLTNGAEADGEVVWSWRPDAGVKCRGFSARRRWQKSPVTGESTKETVKTIAQGRPGVSGGPVVTTLVCFLFCTRGCGCSGHPAFPAPSDFSEGPTFTATTRAKCAARSRSCVCERWCWKIESEAVHCVVPRHTLSVVPA
jgi:hypothetical protein